MCSNKARLLRKAERRGKKKRERDGGAVRLRSGGGGGGGGARRGAGPERALGPEAEGGGWGVSGLRRWGLGGLME